MKTVLLISMAACIVLLAVLVIFYRRAMKKSRHNSEIAAKILATLNPEHGLEKNLTEFLGIIISLIKADSYCFYVLDKKNGCYSLKSIRFRDTEGLNLPTPSYSGLSPYQKERYNPPLNLPLDQQAGVKPVKIGEVPMLVIPVKDGSGLITAGPVKKVKGRHREILQYLSEHLQPALEVITAAEKMLHQVNTITASNEAIRSLARSATDLDGSFAVLLALSIKIIDAAGGCLIFMEDGCLNIMELSGLNAAEEEMFRKDYEARESMYKLTSGRDLVVIGKQMPEYANIPALFAAMGVETMVLARVTGRTMTGLVFYWFRGNHVVEYHRLTALGMLAKRMGDTFDRQMKFRQMSYSYLEILKMMVEIIDNMEPNSVSHSELVSRYAGVIAEEMGQTREEIKEIMLAGYLHDVGSLGLSADILFKEGRYTEVEHETMKLHAEVGASIIESTIANTKVAAFIRHHHERWDGNGYPAGLKEEEIPLGARIISVADMLNAKLAGRKNRSPVPFQQALDSLRAASGTQLDPSVTGALVNWFSKKQAVAVPQKTLGYCWEMRCCPPTLFQTCPAYGQTETHCWDHPEIKCQAHGNTCSTCPLYTEYVQRNDRLRADEP